MSGSTAAWVALAGVLCASPRVEPGLRSVGAALPSGPQEVTVFVRTALQVHPDTEWDAQRVPAPSHVPGAHRSILLVRETVHGIPVAGARLALQSDADGALRRVVGRCLPANTRLPPPPTADLAVPGSGAIWWPTADGLVLARTRETELRTDDRHPRARRVYERVDNDEVLATESTIFDVGVELEGWAENPVTTPELQTFDVELAEDDPLVLRDQVVRTLHCPDHPDTCVPEFFPEADEGAFPTGAPAVGEKFGHETDDDPYAAIQSMQYASRFEQALQRWGWDPAAVWSNLDCTWQEVDPSECQLWIHVNVVFGQEPGGFIPFDGAFYRSKGQIFMGQGAFADSAYDLQVLVHEIGHHVTLGWGSPEPTTEFEPAVRTHTDRGAINEGTSDFYASLIGPTDELFVYFRNMGGLYQGPRTRDVSVPFRCPQNVVGEVHMEGRIWASAMHDIQRELVEGGFADEDGFPTAFTAAMSAIRQIPREEQQQFPAAAAILLDEVEAQLGRAASDSARQLLSERGLVDCGYQIDIADEPSLGAGPEAEPNPLDARFLTLPSHRTSESEQTVASAPIPPAVEHVVSLADDEGGVELRFIPDRWRTTQREDEPLDQEGLVAGALVRHGSEGLGFSQDPQTRKWSNLAEFQFLSTPDPERGEPWHRIRIEGLEPAQSYSIALVSMTSVEGDHFLMDQMQWSFLEAQSDPESESGGSGSADEEEGCACTSAPTRDGAVPVAALVFLLVGARRPRRRSRP